MKKLYISIPISGRDIERVKKEADAWKSVFANDYEVITPLEINPEQDGRRYSQLMGKDIEVLLDCDAIFMCPGWVKSKGCNAEYQIARIYDIEVIE
ncbi:MAG: DUF4406 domain-containing protein [Tannerella sp.]|jgi:hypothetical protein|nr:DUF4406 domain-containing protein [Tannerella sp.]